MPPTKGAPNRRGIARREQIIDAAIELFAENGYRGAGLVALAKRVGMTHAGILGLFGTKEQLLLAVMARRDAVMEDLYHDVLAGGPENFSIENIPSEPEVFTRLAVVLRAESIPTDAPLHGYFVNELANARAAVAGWLRANQETKAMRADFDPVAKAAEIVSFATGIEIQWLYTPDLIDRRAAMSAYLAELTADLAPRG